MTSARQPTTLSIEDNGAQTNFHSSLTIGPRQMSILFFLASLREGQQVATLAGISSFMGCENPSAFMTAVGSMRLRGLVWFSGPTGFRGNAVVGTLIHLTAGGRRLAAPAMGLKTPPQYGVVVSSTRHAMSRE
jgi:hypothetical protein